MWHIVVGLAVLSTVFSLIFAALYKLSGKRCLCRPGQWADNSDEAPSNGAGVTEIRKPSVDWMQLQIHGIDFNEMSKEVPDVVTVQ